MSVRTSTSTKPSTESLRLQMERSIDQLADLARSAIEPGRFFAEVLGRAIQPGGAAFGILWRQSPEGAWEPAGMVPASRHLDAASIELRQKLLTDVSVEEHPRIVSALPTTQGTISEGSHVLSPIRHADQTVGILETAHDVDASGQLPQDTFQFFAALCEITADFLSQHELQQLRMARTVWQQWDQFSHRLWQTLDVASVSAAIANDGRLLAQCDRISVLIRRGHAFQLQAVSGVDRVEARSSAARSLEFLAKTTVRLGHSVWHDLRSETTEPSNESLPKESLLDEALQKHANASGACAIGIVPVIGKRDEKDRSPPCAVLVFEQFQPVVDFGGWQSRGESLAGRSALTLRAALELSDVPWLDLWRKMQLVPHALFRPSVTFGLGLFTAILAAFVLIHAEFTVTGPATLWPDHRREVFASTSGIVDQILVKHGDEVKIDQPLIILRDPELESTMPRIQGEIATVNERLKGVQAARLAGGNTPDALARARQLTADEEELKERLRSLDQQRVLLEARQEALTLRSPLAGQVLTWDVTQLLSARPVERGQSLLTIGETTGPWILDVHVADKDAGHMLRARQTLRKDLEVDFLVASDPGQTHRGRVREVALSSEVDDLSRGFVRVVVAFDREQVKQPRPGATAVPRIRCGRQPLGYVWLHDLIDAIRTRLLF